MTKGAIARGFRDAGFLVALAGTWVLLWVVLKTARHGWGPDMGGIAALFFGAIGLGLFVLGAVIAAVAALVLARSGADVPTSRTRAAVAVALGAVTLASGVYVAAVWAKRLVRERAQERASQEMSRRQEEDRARRAAIWDANRSRLREGLQRCLAAAEPPPGIRASGVSAAEREVLEKGLREKLPAYRLASEREILCVRSLVFPDRLSPDGETLVAAWAVTGRFEGDGAEEIVALATKTDALELDPVLFRTGTPPLVERRDWPGRPAIFLGCVRKPAVPWKPWPPPEREYPGMVYDVVASAILERPLTGPAPPVVRLQWMHVSIIRGVDGNQYVQFASGEPRDVAATKKAR